MMLPCQCCGKELPEEWNWYVCDKCGYRICQSCLAIHKGRYSNGGYKCSQCVSGKLKMKKL